MVVEIIFVSRSTQDTSTTDGICLPIDVAAIVIVALNTFIVAKMCYWVRILHVVAVQAIHALHVEV